MHRPLLLSFFLIFSACHTIAQVPRISILQEKAPETFRAVFTTTKGEFEIEAYRKWSPLGVDRLYQLILSGFYKNALIFRVEPGFVVQFGIAESRAINRFWDPRKLPDEPMQTRNRKGTIAFVRGRANDRCTQLFINTNDNPKLDTVTRSGVKGYTPLARITRGMEIVVELNGQYGKIPATMQDSLYKYGNFYFEERFPKLDKIISARVIK